MLCIEKKDDGGEFELKLGESFEIRLPENPTTGYRWRSGPSVPAQLEVVDEGYDASGAAMGGGGVHHWRLRAVREGQAAVELEYRRSWENRPVDTFRMTLNVKPA
jgi:inhibitor of cysteine peptidase